MVKPRKQKPSQNDVKAVTDKLADKTYGEDKETTVGTSITISQSLLHKVEDYALENKRKGANPKNVSAIVREALVDYLMRINKY